MILYTISTLDDDIPEGKEDLEEGEGKQIIPLLFLIDKTN